MPMRTEKEVRERLERFQSPAFPIFMRTEGWLQECFLMRWILGEDEEKLRNEIDEIADKHRRAR